MNPARNCPNPQVINELGHIMYIRDFSPAEIAANRAKAKARQLRLNGLPMHKRPLEVRTPMNHNNEL